MKKIMIIGSPGAGKSYLARELSEITGIKAYHLDLFFHNTDRTTNSRDYLRERVREVFRQDSWIIDGTYLATMDMRLKECDTVIYLNLDLETCLEGVRSRAGKPRSDMPWIEEEPDPEFIEYVIRFDSDQKPRMEKLLEEYPDKDIIVLTSRQEIAEYLEKLRNE